MQFYVDQFKLADHLSADLLRCLRILRLEEDREPDLSDGEQAKLDFLVEGSIHVLYDHWDGTRPSIGILTPLALVGELDLFVEPDLRLSITTAEQSTYLPLH